MRTRRRRKDRDTEECRGELKDDSLMVWEGGRINTWELVKKKREERREMITGGSLSPSLSHAHTYK